MTESRAPRNQILAASTETQEPDRWIARVERSGPDGWATVGTATALTSSHFVTCAHVLLGKNHFNVSEQRRHMEVQSVASVPSRQPQFRLTATDAVQREAKILRITFHPLRGVDLALIEVDNAELGTSPAPLVIGHEAELLGDLLPLSITAWGHALGDTRARPSMGLHIDPSAGSGLVDQGLRLEYLLSRGAREGQSGGPVVVYVSGRPFCLGVVDLGGRAAIASGAWSCDAIVGIGGLPTTYDRRLPTLREVLANDSELIAWRTRETRRLQSRSQRVPSVLSRSHASVGGAPGIASAASADDESNRDGDSSGIGIATDSSAELATLSDLLAIRSDRARHWAVFVQPDIGASPAQPTLFLREFEQFLCHSGGDLLPVRLSLSDLLSAFVAQMLDESEDALRRKRGLASAAELCVYRALDGTGTARVLLRRAVRDRLVFIIDGLTESFADHKLGQKLQLALDDLRESFDSSAIVLLLRSGAAPSVTEPKARALRLASWTPPAEGDGSGLALDRWNDAQCWLGIKRVHPYHLAGGHRIVGRATEIEWLNEWIRGENPATSQASIACVHALGGGGKTALAWHWLNSSEELLRVCGFRGALWCSFYASSYDFTKFLEDVAEFLNVVAPAARESADYRDELERALLRRLKQDRILLVLDGLERKMRAFAGEQAKGSDDQAHDTKIEAGKVIAFEREMMQWEDGHFLQLLSQSTSRILITTRLVPVDLEHRDNGASLPGVVTYKLDGFTPADGQTFWRSMGLTGDPARLDRTFATFGYHPLIIQVFGCAVRASAAKGDFDAWCGQNPDFDPYQQPEFRTSRRHRILEWVTRDLNEHEWTLLECIATHTDACEIGYLVKVIVQQLRVCETEAELIALLRKLVGRGLLGTDESAGSYDAHPVIRGYVWRRHNDPTRSKERRRIYLKAFSLAHGEDLLQPDVKADRFSNAYLGLMMWCHYFLETGEYVKAWRIFDDRLSPILRLTGEENTRLELVKRWFIGVDGSFDPERLPRLQRRSDQASALQQLHAAMVGQAGARALCESLGRRASALWLLADDSESYLISKQARIWPLIYECDLFCAQRELQRLVANAVTAELWDTAINIATMLAIVLAIRGLRDDVQHVECLCGAALRAKFRHWRLQQFAECYVYLETPDRADKLLAEIHDDSRSAETVVVGQRAWELLTAGFVLGQRGAFEAAMQQLRSASDLARQLGDTLIQAFAYAGIADFAAQGGLWDQVASALQDYAIVDERYRWALPAAHALDARSRWLDARGQHDEAAKVSRLAAQKAFGNGESFTYKAVLTRLDRRGALTSLAQIQPSRPLPHGWRSQLDPLARTLEALSQASRALLVTSAASQQGAGLSIQRSIELQVPQPNDESHHTFSRRTLRWRIPDSLDDGAPVVTGNGQNTGEQDPTVSVPVGAWWDEFRQLNGPLWTRRFAGKLCSAGISAEHLQQALAHVTAQVVDLESVVRVALLSDGARWREPQWRNSASTTRSVQSGSGRADEVLEFARYMQRLLGWLNCMEARATRAKLCLEELTECDLRALCEDAERQLGKAAESEATDVWMRAVQQLTSTDLVGRLCFYEALLRRSVTLVDLASVECVVPLEEFELALAVVDLRGKQPIVTERIGISVTQNWTEGEVASLLESHKSRVDVATTASARKWWSAFENENASRLALVLLLVEEMLRRRATINDFFQAYVYSGTDIIQANLHYLDFTRWRKADNIDRQLTVRPTLSQPLDALLTHRTDPWLMQLQSTAPEIVLRVMPLQSRLNAEPRAAMRARARWNDASLVARQWWMLFEVCLELREPDSAETLRSIAERNATVEEVFASYVYANIQGTGGLIHYLDFRRLLVAPANTNTTQGSVDTSERRSSVVAGLSKGIVDPSQDAGIKCDELERFGAQWEDNVCDAQSELVGLFVREYARAREKLLDVAEALAFQGIIAEASDRSSEVKIESIRRFCAPLPARRRAEAGQLLSCPQCSGLYADFWLACHRCQERIELRAGNAFPVPATAALQFNARTKAWATALEHYPGEVYPELVHVLIAHLDTAIFDAMAARAPFSLKGLSLLITKAAKYLINEKEVVFAFMALLPPPAYLDEPQIAMLVEICEEMNSAYPGVLERLNRKWLLQATVA